MSAIEQLEGVGLPPRVRDQMEKHLSRIEITANPGALHLAQARAEGFVQGLEVAGALNAGTVEALYIAVDNEASARLMELEQ